MITDADWDGGDLDTARQPPTPAQAVWDEAWTANYDTARQRGRTPNQAVQIADTRTEAQKGQRPRHEETT